MRLEGLALLVGFICAPVFADDMQRGCNLPFYGDFNTPGLAALNQSLDQFKADGGEYVSVNTWWFQDNINSTVIQPNYNKYSVTDAKIIEAIDAIHAHGLKVSLKPLVDMSNDPDHWRGQIVGGSTWFNGTNGYDAFISHYAAMAAAKNVELFVVGTELSATNGQTADWVDAVAKVRAQGYTGPITYAANWGGGNSVVERPVAWWSSLDYIGIDAYYQLSGSTLAQKKAAWANQATIIENWWNALPANQRKPILFTEVGYSNNGPDPQAQADWYEALLSTLWKKEPWFKGVYWWDWTPANPPLAYDNLIFQGMPAEQVMASYYTPEPSTLVLALSGMAVLLRRRRRQAGHAV